MVLVQTDGNIKDLSLEIQGVIVTVNRIEDELFDLLSNKTTTEVQQNEIHNYK